MITCEICGTQADQHDHWRHEIMARVAALEDVVTREPAEQPIRQETGGGECPGCACCNDDACPTRHTDCETLCGDRAKAKAAEQARPMCDTPGCGRPIPVGGEGHPEICPKCLKDERGFPPFVPPAEPSGTGQVPSAPAGFRVVGQSGPGVTQSKGLWIRRARDYRDGSPANGELRQITMPGSLGGVWDAGEYDILEPIAEPPAPAAVTLSEDYEDCRKCADRRQHVVALEARLAQAERERDEWRPRYEAAAADARASLTEQAAQLVEREACRVCVTAEAKVLGHTECWRLVKLAREIRRLGMQRDANP